MCVLCGFISFWGSCVSGWWPVGVDWLVGSLCMYSGSTQISTVGYSGSTLALLWEYSGTTLGVPWDYCASILGVLPQYSGSTAPVPWDYPGSTVPVLWEYCASIGPVLCQDTTHTSSFNMYPVVDNHTAGHTYTEHVCSAKYCRTAFLKIWIIRKLDFPIFLKNKRVQKCCIVLTNLTNLLIYTTFPLTN